MDLKKEQQFQGQSRTSFSFQNSRGMSRCINRCKLIASCLLIATQVFGASSITSGSQQAPSQLFLPPVNQEVPVISRVAGLHTKRADEEEDGFIMQTVSTQTLQPDTTTLATTIPDQSIPINVDRQQFVTHDQLSLLNATTKDEYINLTGADQATDPGPPNRVNRAQSSRTSGMSKVSHVSSLISDWLTSYATRPRTQTLESPAPSQQQQVRQNPSTISTNNKQPVTANFCPGVCRNIVSASILCRNEINAPCPIFHKCCDKNDVSFNGTPVETSAPLSPPDSDPNTAPLPGHLPQAQESTTTQLAELHQSPAAATPSPLGEAPSAAPAKTVGQPTVARGGENAGASTGGSMVPATGGRLSSDGESTEQSVDQFDRSIYFLSSANGSSLADKKESLDAKDTRQGVASVALNQRPTEEQQIKITKLPVGGASQSFDSPIVTTTAKPTYNQPVVLLTANGSIVHQPSKRLLYANLTDYRLAMSHQTKAGQGQQVFYYSNIDPAKNFAVGELLPTTAASRATTNATPTTIDLSQTTTIVTTSPTTTTSKVGSCAGLCMPEKHRRFCLAPQSGSQTGCEKQDEFCCLNQTELARQRNQAAESQEQRIMNDQHSGSSPGKSRSPSISQPTTQQNLATTEPPSHAPVELENAKPSNNEQASDPVSGVGTVLVDLIESWFNAGSSQTSNNSPSMSEQTDQRNNYGLDGGQATDQMATYASPEAPAASQNDRRRLGLDLSFKQQPQNDLSTPNNYTSDSQSSDLITSDGASESGTVAKVAGSESSSISCLQPNYCTLHLFELLCDSTYSSADCGPSRKCCVTTKLPAQTRPISELDNNDELGQSATKQQSTPSSFCRGACLAVYQSSLCTKPNELQLDSTGCLLSQVCCSPPSNLPVGTNHLEDLEDARPLAADLSYPKDSALLASLLPAPPPSLQSPVPASDLQQQDQLVAASGRQRQTVSLSDPETTNFQQMYQQQQQQQAPTQKPNTSKSSQAGGIINQLYQMFRSSSPSSSLGSAAGKGQRPRNQQPPRAQQPMIQTMHYMPQIYDPYQMQAQTLQQAVVAASQASLPVAYQQQPIFAGSRPQKYHSMYQLQQQQQQQVEAMQAEQKYPQNRQRFPQTLDSQQQGFYLQNQQFVPQQSVNYQPKMQQQQQSQMQFNQQPSRPATGYQNPQQVMVHGFQEQQPLLNGFQATSVMSQEKPLNMDSSKQMVSFPTVQHQQQTNLDRQRQQQTSYLNVAADNTLTNNNFTPFNQQIGPQNQVSPQHQHPLVFGIAEASVHRPSSVKLEPQRQSLGQKQVQDPASRLVFDNNGANKGIRNGSGQQVTAEQQQRPLLANQPTKPSRSQLQVGSEASLIQLVNQPVHGAAAQPGGQQKVSSSASKQYQQPQLQQFQGFNKLPDSQQQSAFQPTQRADPNRQRQGVNNEPNRSNNGLIQKGSPAADQLSSLQIVSPSPSNVNFAYTNGPFVDLQRFEAINQATSKFGINRQQSFSATTMAPVLHDLGSLSSEQLTPCPLSCLSASANCIQPDYIDDSYTCPITGSVCCMRPIMSPPVIKSDSLRPSSQKVDPLRQQPTSSPALVVNSNKLDVASGDQDEQAEDVAKSDADQASSLAGELTLVASGHSVDEEQPTLSNSRNKFLATQCGLPGPRRRSTSGQAKGRVMGGFDSKPGYWCWQAALMNIKNEYLCGGALIGAKWVLTAAHCITQHLRNQSPLFVRLGQHNLNSTQSNGQAKTIQVKTTYVHHNHNGVTLDNDIALLRLEEAADLEEASICLVCLPERSSQTESGKRCTVTGYGFENESGPAALKIRQTDLPIVTDQECQNKTSAVLGKPFSLPASSFCAGGELGQDACHGDGGSPLSCLVDDYYELTGIVSWGYKCGNKDLPGLYSKVSAFVGWINQIVSVNN